MRTIMFNRVWASSVASLIAIASVHAAPPPQSPINFLLPNYDGTLPMLTFTYNAISVANTFAHTGANDATRSLKITVGANDAKVVVAAHVKDGQNIAEKTYKLKEFHFHIKAEHKLNNAQPDMEVHMVHENQDDASDKLAVGRWISTQTDDNADLDPIFGAGNLPAHNATKNLNGFDLSKIIPILAARNAYYRYDGSLTTGQVDGISNTAVKWYMLADHLKLSAAQIARFQGLFTAANGQNAHGIQTLSPAHKLRTNVPAPSAAVILALGGVVCARRRRS